MGCLLLQGALPAPSSHPSDPFCLFPEVGPNVPSGPWLWLGPSVGSQGP